MNFNTYIKSPKQLHNTYITNDCPIKRDVYLALCERFGVTKVMNAELINTSRFVECTCLEERFGYRIFAAMNVESSSKELHLADLVDLHDSYVMTSDFEVARKFGEMVGLTLADHCDFVCVSCGDMNNIMRWTQSGIDTTHGALDDKVELTTDLINAMHTEMVKLKSLNDDYATERKPVSLTDFLKRTKTMNSGEKLTQATKMKAEYVRVEFSHVWQVMKEQAEGEKFYCKTDSTASGYGLIQDNPTSLLVACQDPIYRRIEKPVDWREEVESYLESACQNETDEFDEFDGMIVSSTDWMCSYNPTDDEFLEMCRVALRATGELPDATK